VFWPLRRPDDSRANQPAVTVEELRSFWQQSLDRLAEYLKKLQREEKHNNGRSS
jgi:sugar-specific transcriptional regulator TrmB